MKTKVGDKICVSNGMSKNIYSVERVTNTMVILKHYKLREYEDSKGEIYFREVGGDTWSRNSFSIATPEDYKKIKTKNNIYKLQKIVSELTYENHTEKMTEIVELIGFINLKF